MPRQMQVLSVVNMVHVLIWVAFHGDTQTAECSAIGMGTIYCRGQQAPTTQKGSVKISYNLQVPVPADQGRRVVHKFCS